MPKIPRVRPPKSRGAKPRSMIPTTPRRPKPAPPRVESTPTPTAISQDSATGPGAPGGGGLDSDGIGTSTAVGTGEGFGPDAGGTEFAYDGPVIGGLDGIHPELARRVSALSAATGGAVGVNSGFRSYEEQADLYCKNQGRGAGCNISPSEATGIPTAPPGQSNHNTGLAVDITGYDQVSPELLDQFGLVQAVPGEPWHLQLDPSVQASTVGDDHFQAMGMGFDLGADQNPEDVLANRLNAITSMLGMDLSADPFTAGDTGMLPGDQDPAYNMVETPEFAGQGMDPDIYPAAAQDSMSGQGDLQRFMTGLRALESGGGVYGRADYGAIGPSTRYGNATGAYQFLDSTWQSRPGTQGYRRAADAPPDVQDKIAAEYMRDLYDRYGDWRLVAVAWHGGEGAADRAARTGRITGSDVNMSTQNYANTIVGRM